MSDISIRCKECKFYHKDTGWCDKHSHFLDKKGRFCYPWESTDWKIFFDNDYCSWGVKKEQEVKIPKQVFIINGSAGVGKDTFISYISTTDVALINYSSIDKVKEIAKAVGWLGKKTEKDRKFLSDLKQLCTFYNDMPFNDLKEKVERFQEDATAILFLHIREPEEIERAKKAFNAKTVLVKRDSVRQIVSNSSDKRVLEYQYDITIDNNGSLRELEEKAFRFANDFKNNELKTVY